MRPSLWRPPASCGGSSETQFDVDGQPRSVLLHQSQHHQDVPDIQGEQCLPDLDFRFLSPTFFQPTEFNQLEHEKRFKLVFKGLLILITVNVVLLALLAQMTEPGSLFGRVNFLSGAFFEQEDSMSKSTRMFLVVSNSITALAMVTSEICARVMRPASTITQPVCSAGFIVNTIPFFTLNFSIVLGIVVHAVTGVFFDFDFDFWLHISVLLTAILVTNKMARKHLASRLRQQIDTITIGGNNTVHPVVSIALVPLRGQTEDAPTLATLTRATERTLCPVEETNNFF